MYTDYITVLLVKEYLLYSEYVALMYMQLHLLEMLIKQYKFLSCI